jgi:hypothetical protein
VISHSPLAGELSLPPLAGELSLPPLAGAGAWSLLVNGWPFFEWQPVNDAALATATPLLLDADHPSATVNLPYVRPGSLSGTVSSGTPQDHDPLANARVYIDRNKDGLFDAGDTATQTDATGRYSFDGRWVDLPPGSYEFRVDLPGQQAAPRVRQTMLASGGTVDSLDFLVPVNVTAVSAVLLGEGTASEEPRWLPVPDGPDQLDPLAPLNGFTKLAFEVVSTAAIAANEIDAAQATLVAVNPDG